MVKWLVAELALAVMMQMWWRTSAGSSLLETMQNIQYPIHGNRYNRGNLRGNTASVNKQHEQKRLPTPMTFFAPFSDSPKLTTIHDTESSQSKHLPSPHQHSHSKAVQDIARRNYTVISSTKSGSVGSKSKRSQPPPPPMPPNIANHHSRHRSKPPPSRHDRNHSAEVVSPFHHPLSHDEALQKINYTAGGYFHIYDIHSNNSERPSCTHFYEEHAKSLEIFPELIQRYKLWSGLIGEERMRQLTPNDTLFGLQHALDIIWKHQHPQDCKNAKFLIPTEHTGGFGSELHVLTNPLGLAMDLDRVYLLNPLLQSLSMWELETPFCRNGTSIGLDCYYEVSSSCTIFDALGANALQVLQRLKKMKFRSLPSGPYAVEDLPPVYTLHGQHSSRLYTDDFLKEINKFSAGRKTLMLHNVFRMGGKYIPRVFRPLMDCSPIIPQFQYYWWRAMTMTYYLRPNERTMAWINEHRNYSFERAAERNNTVGIYVRRGDKSREMRISPLTEYIDAMRLIWSLNYLPNATAPRVIFLASESSEVIDEMTQYVQNHTTMYEMYYTTVFDRKGLLAEKSASERDAGAEILHHPDEYLSMLLNIHHLLQANAWVCTLGSNFCRVFDELRATVGAKAGAPFVDLSEEKCGQPPCIFGGLIDMDWR